MERGRGPSWWLFRRDNETATRQDLTMFTKAKKRAEYKMRTSSLAKNAKSATELVNMRFSWPADSIC
jgi:hypothetical protein